MKHNFTTKNSNPTMLTTKHMIVEHINGKYSHRYVLPDSFVSKSFVLFTLTNNSISIEFSGIEIDEISKGDLGIVDGKMNICYGADIRRCFPCGMYIDKCRVHIESNLSDSRIHSFLSMFGGFVQCCKSSSFSGSVPYWKNVVEYDEKCAYYPSMGQYMGIAYAYQGYPWFYYSL
jgi:hypothetical protein